MSGALARKSGLSPKGLAPVKAGAPPPILIDLLSSIGRIGIYTLL